MREEISGLKDEWLPAEGVKLSGGMWRGQPESVHTIPPPTALKGLVSRRQSWSTDADVDTDTRTCI